MSYPNCTFSSKAYLITSSTKSSKNTSFQVGYDFVIVFILFFQLSEFLPQTPETVLSPSLVQWLISSLNGYLIKCPVNVC